jgi:AhpD family alkylhydroperoxidase
VIGFKSLGNFFICRRSDPVENGWITMEDVYEILKKREQNRKRLEEEASIIYLGLNELLKQCYKPGELARKHKELIAVACAVATRCVPCLANHLNNTVKAGASRDEVVEAAAVGVEFGGGPSFVIVRNNLLDFLDQIEQKS